MRKGLLFLFCSCFILVSTIINFSIGPIISGKADKILGYNLATLNCQKYKDILDDVKIKGGYEYNEIKFQQEYDYDSCQMQKILHHMEYISFIFNIFIGFICGFLSLLHLFEVRKDLITKSSLIGLISGIIGFVITLVYVFYNRLVYTTVHINNMGDIYLKRDSDYAYAEKYGDKFKCIFFEDKFYLNSIYAKISDLGKKQYNYKNHWEENIEKGCDTYTHIFGCMKQETFSLSSTNSLNKCKKLYVPNSCIINSIENKDLSDRFLTTLILSLFVCLANGGLYLLGFLLCKNPEDF